MTLYGKEAPSVQPYPHGQGRNAGSLISAKSPNRGQQDIAEVKKYRSDFPDESYEDVEPSYASNEIAINWNASLVAAITWLAHIGNEL